MIRTVVLCALVCLLAGCGGTLKAVRGAGSVVVGTVALPVRLLERTATVALAGGETVAVEGTKTALGLSRTAGEEILATAGCVARTSVTASARVASAAGEEAARRMARRVAGRAEMLHSSLSGPLVAAAGAAGVP